MGGGGGGCPQKRPWSNRCFSELSAAKVRGLAFKIVRCWEDGVEEGDTLLSQLMEECPEKDRDRPGAFSLSSAM